MCVCVCLSNENLKLGVSVSKRAFHVVEANLCGSEGIGSPREGRIRGCGGLSSMTKIQIWKAFVSAKWMAKNRTIEIN